MKLEMSSQVRDYTDNKAILNFKEKQNSKSFLNILQENNDKRNNKIHNDNLLENEQEDDIKEFLSSIISIINNITNNDSERQDIKNNDLLDIDIYENTSIIKNFLVENNTDEINKAIEEVDRNNYIIGTKLNNKPIGEILNEILKKISNEKVNINQDNIVYDYKKENSEIEFGKEIDAEFTGLNKNDNTTLDNKLGINKIISGDEHFDKNIKILKNIVQDDSSKNVLFVNQEILNISNNISSIKYEINPSIAIRESVMVEDIVKNINYLQSNDLKELKVNLSPKELGDMVIKIIKSEKESRVLITVSKEEIFNLVSKNIDEINKHLSDLDIRVKDVEVEIKSDNQNYFSENFNNESKEGNSKRSHHNTYGNEDNIDILEEEKSSDENLNLLA
ncbi:flagellar hook-length control protein FliK [Romboutsia weinsteinii]|uniref:Flagellar hook-length control protein FliK n=1 Tax=Romboutsia weinsteinii TaxID=2020949 RepID=A0A371J8C7_9FIRM|nr:flagellar hook-length control protein FliK [Romboutsia weinsteinii]RDY28928.1 flagellar hook-length control protein FliK [Romboutsia weinsteinii]